MRTNQIARVMGFALAAVLLLAPSLFAQLPTGTATGRVIDGDNAGLPGVTVTATSSTLQGARVAVTSGNGDFKLAFLPPGSYKLTYELEGFATAIQEALISGSQTQNVTVTMQVAELVEEIVVTSALEVISEGTGTKTTYGIGEIEDLPVARNIRSATLLTPGVAATGPKQAGSRSPALSIAGAMSFESLYLVNGVVVNENLRGQSLDLFIEDAIQEFTTITNGASAEYGRFTGGVINVLTKSGGNDFNGSIRRSYNQDDWTNATDFFDEAKDDTLNETDELTIGGPFWKDHIWFFGAFRDIGEASTTRNTAAPTSIAYNRVTTQERMEGKLTLTPHPSHSLVANYLEIEQTSTNGSFGNILDLASLSDRNDPQELKSGHYTGIFGSNFFAEAQFSERDYLLGDGSGSQSTDLIGGTVIRHAFVNSRYHTGTFCGVCPAETRNNENTLAKASYFLTSDDAGSHDIVFGYDTFTDIRKSDNHQSGSDFQVWHGADPIIQGGDIFPVFTGGSGDWMVWFPILEGSKGTDLVTNSAYVNDTWQVSDQLSLSLGLRYDENDGQDAEGKLIAQDSRISPRLGLTYDVQGDGEWIVNATAGRYVAALNNGAADQTSAAGSPAVFVSNYLGPAINANGVANQTQDQALQTIFDWWFANGGTSDPTGNLSNLPGLFYSNIPGATSVIENSLDSPYVDEITFGVSKRLGNKGIVRADVVLREFGDFYAQETSLRTGQVTLPSAGSFDRTVIYNEDDLLNREYTGILTNFRYRATDKLSINGNYTWSKAEGNFNGENAGSGSINGGILAYPEYTQASWNAPDGELSTNQTHNLRLWGIYDVFNTDHHSLNASLLLNYSSGTPYSGSISIDPSPYVTNPGYLTPTTSVTYFVTDRGAFTTEEITRLDFSINYTFNWNLWNRDFEIFVQPEMLNVLNDQSFVRVDNTVNATGAFDPFNTTPVEGTNYDFGSSFGDPLTPEDVSLPRTYRVSVGFRF